MKRERGGGGGRRDGEKERTGETERGGDGEEGGVERERKCVCVCQIGTTSQKVPPQIVNHSVLSLSPSLTLTEGVVLQDGEKYKLQDGEER